MEVTDEVNKSWRKKSCCGEVSSKWIHIPKKSCIVSTAQNKIQAVQADKKSIVQSICAESLSSSNSLSAQMRCHIGEKLYSCSICSMTFAQSYELRAHQCGESTTLNCSVVTENAMKYEDNFTAGSVRTEDEQTECCAEVGEFIPAQEVKQENDKELQIKDGPTSGSEIKEERNEIVTDNALSSEHNEGPERREQTLIHDEDLQNSLSSSNSLSAHTRTHTGEKPYSCSICSRTYVRSKELKQHMGTHLVGKPYSCSICTKSFAWSVQLSEHMKSHSREKPYSCSICSKAFDRSSALKAHMRTHTGEKSNTCSICSKAFAQSCKLRAHRCGSFCESTKLNSYPAGTKHDMKHKDHITVGSDNTEDEQTECCEEIREVIPEQEVKHENDEEMQNKEEPTSDCEYNDWTLRAAEQKQSEIKEEGDEMVTNTALSSEHNEVSVKRKQALTHDEDVGKKNFDLEVEVTDEVDKLQRKKRRRGKGSRKLTNCKHIKKVSTGRTKHNKIQAEKRAYSCSICSRTFVQSNSLREHMKTHAGEKPYVCSVCTESYSWAYQLSEHMRIHTVEKSHRCSVCSKTFARSSALKIHTRIHTGENLYLCSVCPKSFAWEVHLTAHMRIHSRGKPYSCYICSKTFVWSKGLKEHMRTHTGQKPYSCSICFKTFARLYELKAHHCGHLSESTKLNSCSVVVEGDVKYKDHVPVVEGDEMVTNTALSSEHNDGLERGEQTPIQEEKNHGLEMVASDEVDKLQRKKRRRGKRGANWSFSRKKFREKISSGLTTHNNTEAKGSTCTESLSSSNSSSVHMRTHAGATPYSCSVCSKKFVWSCTLKAHMRTHTGEKPHQSCQFGKSTKLNSCSDVKYKVKGKWQQTTTQEENVEEENCDLEMEVTDEDSLTEHIETHAGEKSHQNCQFGKSTKIKSCSDVKYKVKGKGQQTTTQEENMEENCDLEMEVTDEDSLTEHIETHAGEKSHQNCQFGKSTKLKSYSSGTKHDMKHKDHNTVGSDEQTGCSEEIWELIPAEVKQENDAEMQIKEEPTRNTEFNDWTSSAAEQNEIKEEGGEIVTDTSMSSEQKEGPERGELTVIEEENVEKENCDVEEEVTDEFDNKYQAEEKTCIGPITHNKLHAEEKTCIGPTTHNKSHAEGKMYISLVTHKVYSGKKSCISPTTHKVHAGEKLCIGPTTHKVHAGEKSCIGPTTHKVHVGEKLCIGLTTHKVHAGEKSCISTTTNKVHAGEKSCIGPTIHKVHAGDKTCIGTTTNKVHAGEKSCISTTTHKVHVGEKSCIGPKKHNKLHAVEKPYFCSVCSKSFAKSWQWSEHMKIHMKPHSSSIRSKTFVESSVLRIFPKRSFPCSVCGESFVWSAALKTHMRTHTGEKPYNCSVCSKTFVQSNGLKLHMKTHTEEKPHVCSVCTKSFALPGKLSEHMRIHTGEKPYSCSICSKTFAQSIGLKIHMKIHSGEKPYLCSVCGKSFAWQRTLSEHMRIHTGEKPYTCSFCSRTFAQSNALKVHLRTHTGEKPYKSSTCGKAFSQNSSLTTHKWSHAEEQPHKCSLCPKSFAFLTYLKLHMNTHTGEKPYSCSVCGKSYAHPSYLSIHKRTHEVKPSLTCSTCNKSFTQPASLKVHMRIHTKERPFICDVCGKTFNVQSNFRKHLQTHNKDKP